MNLSKKPISAQRSEGFRSGLEQKIAQNLIERGVDFKYEDQVIHYVKPEKVARYTPDFNIITHSGKHLTVESKGRFLTADRQKHLLVKAQHPDRDIRMVFSRSKERISKKSRTTYGMWCEKNSILYADEMIPESWLKE